MKGIIPNHSLYQILPRLLETSMAVLYKYAKTLESVLDECSCLEWSGHEEPSLIWASVHSSWQLNICIPKTLVNWINLTEFVTLPVQDERDLIVCNNNWQYFKSQGMYIIYNCPVQWVTLHDIQVYFKVDVVHWLFMRLPLRPAS